MFLIRALTRKNGVRILIIDNTGRITAKTREYKNLKIKNLLAYNLPFKLPINKNLFSPENEKQVIFQNHISEMQLQSSARILFGELGTWHCCANKTANLLTQWKNKVKEVNIVVSHFEIDKYVDYHLVL